MMCHCQDMMRTERAEYSHIHKLQDSSSSHPPIQTPLRVGGEGRGGEQRCEGEGWWGGGVFNPSAETSARLRTVLNLRLHGDRIAGCVARNVCVCGVFLFLRLQDATRGDMCRAQNQNPGKPSTSPGSSSSSTTTTTTTSHPNPALQPACASQDLPLRRRAGGTIIHK